MVWELKVINNSYTQSISLNVAIYLLKCFCNTENPVLLPVCDKKKSCMPSTNDQFQFEVESHLNSLLEEQYEEVCMPFSITKMTKHYIY